MFDAERAGTGDGDAHSLAFCFRRLHWPDDDVPDGSVGCGHVVEAVELLDASAPCAPRMISHITISTPSEPDSRRYSKCGILRSSSGSAVRLSRKRGVELLVDQPGARALQLMTHAAGAPHLDVQVFGVALDGPAQ